MSLLDRMERRVGRFGVPYVTVHLIVGQVACFILGSARPELLERVNLVAGKVLEGEVWRLFTFLLIPPGLNLFWAFFAWYLFYLMGMALEGRWGVFRYNVFLLIAYLATVALSFATPSVPCTNAFIGGSVFLAFAYLYPDFQLQLFFILPVRIKWLAMLTWIGYGLALIGGSWSIRLSVVASVSNFFLFFGRDVFLGMRSKERRMRTRVAEVAKEGEAFHSCAACGITDKSHPKAVFRYCTDCKPALGYCAEHIDEHEHVGDPLARSKVESRKVEGVKEE